MCGLAGSFTQTSKNGLSDKQRLRRARVLEGLLYANASRGTDATGIATICGDDRCIYKRAIPSYQFVDDKTARKHMRTTAPIIIGHTRYGTHGKNEDQNAHPFEEGHIVGAHNGVISNYSAIDSAIRQERKVEYKDWNHVAVDSQAVFRLLDFAGPGGYIEALKKVRGSAALVWHDNRNKKGLWMVRHTNPLNLGFVPHMNTLFWSSQYDHLSSVMWSVFGDQWFTVGTKENVLYLFKQDDILDFDSWDVKFDEPKYTASSYNHGGSNYNDYDEYWASKTGRTASVWDEDDDGDVEHPYAVATVTRKDEGKGKAASTSTSAGASQASSNTGTPRTVTTTASPSSPGMDNVVAVLNRMGIPFEGGDESEPVVSGSLTSTSEEEVGPAPFDDPNCAVCQQPLEAVELGKYFRNTGEWVCSACVSYWEDEGNGNLLEMMGHYAH